MSSLHKDEFNYNNKIPDYNYKKISKQNKIIKL